MGDLRLVSGSAPAIVVVGPSRTLGRAPDVDLRVDHASVSRRHARFDWDGRAWTLHDLGSANGTFVDGERVASRELRGGEQVAFGQALFHVELGGGDRATQVIAWSSPPPPAAAGPSAIEATLRAPSRQAPPPQSQPPTRPPTSRPAVSGTTLLVGLGCAGAALLALLAVGIVAWRASRPRAAATPGPSPTTPQPPPPIALVGQLVEEFSGRPVPDFAVQLETRPSLARGPSTTDAAGRFRFEGLPRGLHFSLVQAGKTYNRLRDGELKAPGAELDLGTLPIAADAVAEAIYGPACRSGRLEGVPLQKPVLLSSSDGRGYSVDRLHDSVLQCKTPLAPLVVCVRTSYEEVGTYSELGGSSRQTGKAYRSDWSVRVLRPGGKVSRRSFSADPPQQRTRSRDSVSDDEFGDPRPAAQEWLCGG